MGKFPCKILRKTYIKTLPRRVLYLDVETKRRQFDDFAKNRLLLGWSCFTNYDISGKPKTDDWNYHTDTKLLNNYIESLAIPNKPFYLVGHNIFFDLQSSDFFHYFTLRGWILDFYYDAGLTYILCITKEKRTIKIISSTNFFQTSLEKIGLMLGMPKQKVDFENVTRKELSGYCKNDVLICKLAMESLFSFIYQNDLGKFTMTRAGQALQAFRHRFMKDKINIHEIEHIKKLERRAYFGGRCECFEIGKISGAPFVSLDVNSMYPYAMQKMNVPTRLVDFYRNPSKQLLKDILKCSCIVADVLLTTSLPIYAYRQGQKVIYPVGTFKTTLCTPGVKEALRRGHLKKIYSLACYESAVIFKDFIDFFYGLREKYKKEGNVVFEQLCKFLLNSLYGKFAQKRTLQDFVIIMDFSGYFRIDNYDLVTGEKTVEYKMFNKYVVEYGKEEGDKSFTAISAHITESARLLLWGIIEQVGTDKILYCDTDSIKIRKSDLHLITYPIDKYRLGALKNEGEFETFHILGAKAYITETHRKIKGIPTKAREIRKGVYEYETFLRQISHMRQEVTRYFITRTTTKQLSFEYDKGVVLPSGRIRPIKLSFPLKPS